MSRIAQAIASSCKTPLGDDGKPLWEHRLTRIRTPPGGAKPPALNVTIAAVEALFKIKIPSFGICRGMRFWSSSIVSAKNPFITCNGFKYKITPCARLHRLEIVNAPMVDLSAVKTAICELGGTVVSSKSSKKHLFRTYLVVKGLKECPKDETFQVPNAGTSASLKWTSLKNPKRKQNSKKNFIPQEQPAPVSGASSAPNGARANPAPVPNSPRPAGHAGANDASASRRFAAKPVPAQPEEPAPAPQPAPQAPQAVPHSPEEVPNEVEPPSQPEAVESAASSDNSPSPPAQNGLSGPPEALPRPQFDSPIPSVPAPSGQESPKDEVEDESPVSPEPFPATPLTGKRPSRIRVRSGSSPNLKIPAISVVVPEEGDGTTGGNQQ